MKKFLYRVKKGDTLFSISEKFNLSINLLIEHNNLKCEVSPYDLLVIEQKDCQVYVVCRGEQKVDILNKFNLTEKEFRDFNGDIPYVFYGQKVFLPK